jgi:DNA polymerase III subunit epsilon
MGVIVGVSSPQKMVLVRRELPGMDFVVVDVETANADLSSVCQVGIASFRDGQLADSFVSLVNPEDYFSPVNISIHRINEDCVADAPTWGEVLPEVSYRFLNQIVVSHTPFDRLALTRACDRYNLAGCECKWLDSARVVRRAWPQFARSGYGLSNVAQHFGIAYQAHDALEDARCAGLILLRAIAETGLGLEEWLVRVTQPIGAVSTKHGGIEIERDGNPDGEMGGEVLVFTGALSISRREAADAAAAVGCEVDAGVTKRTTMLVVGDQDLRRLAGHEKSSKHIKAEELIHKGQRIRILGESDFMRIVTTVESSIHRATPLADS